VRIGSAAVTLSGRVWRIVLTILRLPMELLSLASFKAQQVRPPARPRPDQPPKSTRCRSLRCKTAHQTLPLHARERADPGSVICAYNLRACEPAHDLSICRIMCDEADTA